MQAGRVRWVDHPFSRWLFAAVVFAAMLAVYEVGRRLGFKVGGFPWPFWPANGLVFAILVRIPRRAWPLVAGAQLVGELVAGALVGVQIHAATVSYAFVDAGESLLAASLVRRWAGEGLDLRSQRQVAQFLAASLTAVLAAAACATAIGIARGSRAPLRFWGIFAVGDALGFLMIAPAVLRLLEGRRPEWSLRTRRRALEAAGLGVALTAVTAAAFLVPWPSGSYALVHAVIPVLAWCTLRLGTSGGSAGLLLVAVTGTVLTPLGHGPFAFLAPGTADAFAAMQLFFAFVAATALLFGAAVAERRSASTALAQMARTEGVGSLAGAVAHDFGNFLSAILATADAARLDLAPDHPVQSDLQAITLAGRSATQLTRQLLALGRGGGGRPAVGVVDVGTIVAELERLLRHVAGVEARLAIRAPPVALPVLVDRLELERVLCNLVGNARAALRPGGSIEIELEQVALPPKALDAGCRHGALLRVTDDGHGMDRRTLERVFEPFFTTKLAGQGTGLGLSTVKEVVRRAGGTVEVASVLGQGTTVSIVLPLVGPPVDPQDRSGRLAASTP